MKKKGVAQFLIDHVAEKPVSFHMPGHKGGDIYRENGYGKFLDIIMDGDITEIPGADNLFQPESIIKETMDKYKVIYGSAETYLLINGSSAGLIAAIMATVPEKGKMVLARNCHKSIFNGLAMAGAEPVYAYPEVIDEYGISGEITVDEIKRCLEVAPDATAVLIPSPNYYGICSDIKAIAEYVHSLGKVLIVDQAHGAHLTLFDKYIHGSAKSAENLGADIVINSTHKTLASFTQSAIVNLCSDRVDKYIFQDKLQLIESTSPSYVLMASLDINADLMADKGEELVRSWNDDLTWFYDEAKKIKGLKIMEHPMLDYTKINLDMSQLGIDGLQLEKILMEKGIYVELVTGNILMCMTGIGNKRYDYQRLIHTLSEISSNNDIIRQKGGASQGLGLDGGTATTLMTQTLTVKKLEQRDIPKEKEYVLLDEAVGKVCAASIIPYPPGIPIICPGEIMDEQVLDYVRELREKGEKVMGIDDMGRVVVGKN